MAGLLSALGGSVFGGITSGITGGISNFVGGLFGGGKKKRRRARRNAVLLQQEADYNVSEDDKDIAGRRSGSTSTEMPISLAERAGQGLQEMGVQFAQDFTEELSARFISNKVDQWTNNSPPEKSPTQRGMDQRAYLKAAHPELNPYELGGRGTGAVGATAQGGLAAAYSQQGSARRVAAMNLAPKIKSVNLEYQKAPSEIAQRQTQTQGTALHNKWIQSLNNARKSLIEAQTFETGTRDVKQQAETEKIEEQAVLIGKQVLTEIQRTGIAASNNKIQKALAGYAEILAIGKIGAPLIGALGGLSFILGRLSKSLPGKIKKSYGNINPKTGVITPGRKGSYKSGNPWK